MKILPIIYLTYMFIGLYLTSFFILMYLKNKNRIFHTPKPAKKYTVGVIIPAYNEEKTIKDTIKNVLASIYPVKEIIVVNDGSTDNTKKIVQKLVKKDKRIRLINKKNTAEPTK